MNPESRNAHQAYPGIITAGFNQTSEHIKVFRLRHAAGKECISGGIKPKTCPDLFRRGSCGTYKFQKRVQCARLFAGYALKGNFYGRKENSLKQGIHVLKCKLLLLPEYKANGFHAPVQGFQHGGIDL